jgi:serine/threonine-protein kinase
VDWICSHCGEKFSRSRTRCPSDGHRVVEDLSGVTIGGRYKVRELIGVGGMDSTVWKAWQTGTERTVAIKVLPPADEAAAKRFARGARIAANLTHPNCLVIHDYGATEDGKLYLVMEFLPGQVLTDVLGDEPLGVLDTIHVADQVLQALEHAHSRRAVHRDLKPDNLFVTRKNDDALHIKILDYGIAKYIEEDPTEPSTEQAQGEGLDDQVTEQRQVCGTPQYMAPEQVVGGRVDARTDVYSLGVVMYRMLTGRLPFDGKTRYELYQKHLQEAPPTFRDAARPDVGELPRQLELVVMRALAKNPGQRFQSAAEMRRALHEIDLEDARPRAANAPRVAIKSTTPHGPQAAAKKGVTVVLDGIPEESAEDFAPPTLVFPDAPIQPRRGTVSLQASVPAPSQTEPNSSEIGPATPPPAAARPQRRWLVAVVLIGAFLIGVGGVAGLMSLLRAQPEESTLSEAGTALAAGAAEPVGAGAEPLAVTATGEEPGTPPDPEAPREVVPPSAVGGAEDGAAERAGVVAGAALGELEAPPQAVVTRFEFHVDSVPRGAEVRVGDQDFGETPAILDLPAGQHTLTLNLRGYAPEALVIQVSATSRPADLRRTLYLSRKAAPPARRWTPRATDDDDDDDDGGTPPPREDVPAAPRKPHIDLLDELEPAPKKKPSVQLLDDAPDPAKKPPTTETKPKPKPKPKVDLLDQ